MQDSSPNTVPETARDFVNWLNRRLPAHATVIVATHPRSAIEWEVDIRAGMAFNRMNFGVGIPEGDVRDLVAAFIGLLNQRADPRDKPSRTHRAHDLERIKAILSRFPVVAIPDGDSLGSHRLEFKFVPRPDVHPDAARLISTIYSALNLRSRELLWKVRRCPEWRKPRCKGWFECRNRKRKWCSDGCRKADYKSKPEIAKKNRKYMRDYMKKYRKWSGITGK
jgi:hypothetical protein